MLIRHQKILNAEKKNVAKNCKNLKCALDKQVISKVKCIQSEQQFTNLENLLGIQNDTTNFCVGTCRNLLKFFSVKLLTIRYNIIKDVNFIVPFLFIQMYNFSGKFETMAVLLLMDTSVTRFTCQKIIYGT